MIPISFDLPFWTLLAALTLFCLTLCLKTLSVTGGQLGEKILVFKSASMLDTWLETIRMLRGAGGRGGGTELQKQESVHMNLGIPGASLRSQNIQEFFHLNGPAETMWIFHQELSVIFLPKKVHLAGHVCATHPQNQFRNVGHPLSYLDWYARIFTRSPGLD